MDESEAKAYYDEFATTYEQERGRGYHAMIDELEVGITLPLARGARVLEVGCGTGLILERLAERADDAWGVDISTGMLAKAKARGLQVEEGSATKIPFADDEFDLVCSFKVLAHVPDIGAALAEMARVTRPGGHMVVEFYNPWSLRYLAKRLAGPQPIGDSRSEADVFTRWDAPWVVPKLLPPGVELVDFRGVRVVTPIAAIHRIPLLAKLVEGAERAAVRSPLRYLAGFLVAILRKQD